MASAKELFNLPGISGQYEYVSTTACGAVVKQIISRHAPNTTDEVAEPIVKEITRYIAESFRNVLIKQYKEHFSEVELQELYDFYSKPIAVKLMGLTPVFAQEYSDWLISHTQTINRFVIDALKKA